MDQKIIERVKKLREEIEGHNHSYYVLDNPTVDDYTYDMLMQELNGLEEQYPELADKNSPTQRVGGEALNLFEKVEGESKIFHDKTKFQQYLPTNPGLQRIIKWKLQHKEGNYALEKARKPLRLVCTGESVDYRS